VTVLRASQRPRESWVATYRSCCTAASESQRIKTEKGCAGKGCWPHPRVRSLSWGGPRGHCRYPEDRVPPRTSIKSRQRLPPPKLGAAPGLPCVPVAPAPASRLKTAPGLPCVPVAPAPASRPGAAPGPPRGNWAPAPTIWLMATPELLRILRTGSAGRKKINKYPLATRPS
jgi:hypothetical protein